MSKVLTWIFDVCDEDPVNKARSSKAWLYGPRPSSSSCQADLLDARRDTQWMDGETYGNIWKHHRQIPALVQETCRLRGLCDSPVGAFDLM